MPRSPAESGLLPIEGIRIPVSYAQMAISVVRAAGLDAQALLQERADLSAAQWKDPSGMMEGRQFQSVLKLSSEFVKGREDLQRAFVEALPLTVHGHVGLAIMSAPTVEAAIERAVRWQHYAMPAIEFSGTKKGSQFEIQFGPKVNLEEQCQIFDEACASVMLSFLRLAVADFEGVSLQLRHERLTLDRLASIYPGLTVRMSASKNAVNCASELLGRTNPWANASTLAMVEQTLSRQAPLLDADHPLTFRVSSVIRHSLQNGETVTATDVAAKLNLSLRSMRRHLADEHSHFMSIYQQNRTAMAKSLLLNTALSVSKISDRLGFSSEAAFSRFFSQQTGQSATQFRREGSPGN